MKKHTHTTIEVSILEKTKAYASGLLVEKLPAAILFHTLEHTLDVVKAVEKIGLKSGLNENEMETILLAAWLHDTGYCYDAVHHEEESIKIANTFLSAQHYPPEQIGSIANCIAATKIPQNPQNLLEQVLCDADLAHLGKKGYSKKAELLRKETSLLENTTISQREWLQTNTWLLKSHTFFTKYGRHTLSVGQDINYKKCRRKLKLLKSNTQFEHSRREPAKILPLKEEKEAFSKPARGIETMFRTTSHNHMELSAIADNKANIMITINSINISLIVSLLLRRFEEFPNLVLPTAILTCVSLLSIIFAVLVTRPIITSGKFSREDILEKRTNLLFFGNFHYMPLDEYEWGMKQIMQSSEMLYSNLIHDIYSIGKVLGRKYRMLRLCYSIFMYGIITSILAYTIAIVFFPVS